jgi:hypothetical protein
MMFIVEERFHLHGKALTEIQTVGNREDASLHDTYRCHGCQRIPDVVINSFAPVVVEDRKRVDTAWIGLDVVGLEQNVGINRIYGYDSRDPEFP